MMQLQMREQRQDGVVILAPEGRLDSGKIDQFQKTLQERIREGHHRLLIDCSNLVFAASSALRVLLLAVRRLNEVGGELVLCNMNPHILSIFETCGFTKLMVIRNTFDEGFAEVRPPQAEPDPEPDETAEPEQTAETPPPTADSHEEPAARQLADRRERVITTVALAPFRLIAAVGRFLIR